MTTEKLRVVVADDHPAMRMGLVTALEKQPDILVVGEAASGPDAVELCRRQRPDVVLMDLRMPGGSGLEAIARIVAEKLKTKVVVLTTFDLDEDIYRAVRAGAKAFLLKDSTIAEIAATVRSVHRGEKVLPPRIETQLGARQKRVELTERELQILQLVVKGRSNKEISSDLFISEATVKTHLKEVFLKLGVCARTEAAIAAVRTGLVYL